MIVSLTANPSVDHTITLAGPLERGAVLRVAAEHSQPGGKGVNISLAAVAADVPTVAVLPVGRDHPFASELVARGVMVHPLDHGASVRVNLALTEPDGTTTKVNSAGDAATPATMAALANAVLHAVSGAAWVVLAGSLPPGAETDWYADLVRRLHHHGVRIAVDTSEAPLAALVAALPESAPHLMKPNGEELASLTGVDPALLESDPIGVAKAARLLVDRGVGAVLATLGPHGGVLVTADDAWHATPPPTTVVSTVGAGDSSLFGYLLGDLRGLAPAPRLALAVAYGSAAAGLPGTTLPHPSETRADLVSVRRLDLTQGG